MAENEAAAKALEEQRIREAELEAARQRALDAERRAREQLEEQRRQRRGPGGLIPRRGGS